MSHPARWYIAGLVGRRLSILVAVAAGVMLAGSLYGQGREAMDAVMHAGDSLAKADNDNLLAIITVCSLILAGFFGWLEKTSLQVIQQKVTDIESALVYSGILKKGDGK